MKIKIGDYEVEIKAKGVYNKEKFNKQDTMSFLNELSIVYTDSSKFNMGQGYQALAKCYNESGKEIYETLVTLGLYENL